MRRFDELDWGSVPDGALVLMTADGVVDGAPMAVADFRDTQALVFVKTGHYVGMSPTRGLRFGRRPARMVAGVWMVDEDGEAEQGWEDARLTPERLSLEVIR